MRFPAAALGLALLLSAIALFGPAHGLRAEYYAAAERTGTPLLTGIDDNASTVRIARRWRGAAPSTFTVRWLGYLSVTRTGQYTFALTSDDGGMLAIDGQEIVRDPAPHGPHTQVGAIALSAGPHTIEVQHQQRAGGYVLDLQWAHDGTDLVPIPDWRLTPERTASWKLIAVRTASLAAIALVGLAASVGAWNALHALQRRPAVAVLLLFVLLAVVHTWPMATDPGHLSRQDNRDTLLNQWIMSFVAHQAIAAPTRLFEGNIFYPEHDTIAYSEAMLVQSALGAPLLWSGASPVLVYNLLVIAGMALSGWALALVVRRWTGDWTAGIVAGCAAGFSAHTLTRLPHLQAQHVEFLPLALLALDDLLTRPNARAALRVALWSTLQAFTSVYLLVFTAFAMAAGVIVRPRDWLGARFVPFVRALAAGAVVSALLLIPFLLPYYRVSREQGLVRSLADAAQYSASINDYLTTPARVHGWWSPGFHGTTGLFPGALALVLAAIAIVRGTAFSERRARMAVAFGLIGGYLSFGPSMPGYAALYQLTPLLQAIRATARFGYLVTLAVAILAGFGVVHIKGIVPPRRWGAIAALLVTIAALEPLAAPLGLSRFDGIAPIYDRVPQDPGTVVVEMPFFGPRSVQFHAHYMLNSTRHWRPIVNGYSGFQPPSFYAHAQVLQGFPDDASIAMLRDLRVTHVFVHRAQMTEEQLSVVATRRELQLVDSFGETELYRLAE